MKPILVELDRQTVERLINEHKDRLVQLEGETTTVTAEIARLRSAIDAANSGNGQMAGQTEPPKTPGGRVKRGESAKVLESYLKENRVHTMSIKDIAIGTGLKYATANRIVHNLHDAGTIKRLRGKWIWQE